MVQRVDPTGAPEDLAAIGYDGLTWDRPWNLPRGQITTLERMPSAWLETGGDTGLSDFKYFFGFVLKDPASSQVAWSSFSLRALGRRARRSEATLLVVHHGRIVHESYRDGLREDDLHVVHSCSKTLTTMMIGWAVEEGRLSPEQPMQELITELAEIPAWNGVSLQHVLDMAAGLDTEEHYENADSMYWRYADAVGYFTVPADRQIGALEFVRRELVTRLEEPGSRFNYASYLTNLLPVVLEREYAVPAVDL